MGKVKGSRQLKKASTLVRALEDEAAATDAEVRTLGGKASELPNEALFFTDREPTAKQEVRNKLLSDEKKSRKEPRARRSEAALVPNPNVRAVPAARVVGQVGALKDGVPRADAKVVERAAATGKYSLKGRKVAKRTAASQPYDLWNSAEDAASEPAAARPRKSAGRESSAQVLPTRRVAPAGASINPGFEDHQDLLGEAVAREMQKEHAMDLVDEKLRAAEDEDAAGNEGVADEDDAAPVKVGAATASDKKTITQRNRERRRIAADRQAEERVARKRLIDDIENLDELVAELKRREIPDCDKVARKMHRRLMRKVAGRHVPREELDYALSSELKRHMREVKLKGDLLKEKFISLQRRGFAIPKAKTKSRNRRS